MPFAGLSRVGNRKEAMTPNHFFTLCTSPNQLHSGCSAQHTRYADGVCWACALRMEGQPVTDEVIDNIYRDIFLHDVDERAKDTAYK